MESCLTSVQFVWVAVTPIQLEHVDAPRCECSHVRVVVTETARVAHAREVAGRQIQAEFQSFRVNLHRNGIIR